MPKPFTARPAPPHTRPPKKPIAETDHPPPEDELGGGDICSLEEAPSTDDDKPLD